MLRQIHPPELLAVSPRPIEPLQQPSVQIGQDERQIGGKEQEVEGLWHGAVVLRVNVVSLPLLYIIG